MIGLRREVLRLTGFRFAGREGFRAFFFMASSYRPDGAVSIAR